MNDETLDQRNVTDEFKNVTHDDIVAALDARGVSLEIAIENLERDFNMGTIVRNANAFGVRKVHVIGRRQWNKRGAMMTDKYLEVVYHADAESFCAAIADKSLLAVDIVPGATPLSKTKLPSSAVLLFGAEGPGISQNLLERAANIVYIEQLGSTRSINVGVASGIAMYEWSRRQWSQ